MSYIIDTLIHDLQSFFGGILLQMIDNTALVKILCTCTNCIPLAMIQILHKKKQNRVIN